MGLLDVFKQNKKTGGKRKQRVRKPKTVKKVEEKKDEIKSDDMKISSEIKSSPKKKDFSDAYKILKEPHITEKASDAESGNQYIFKVFPSANKIEIKKAVRDLFGVSVLGVNIINIHQKRKRFAGRRSGGYKEGYKKAIVTLREGHKIEILPR